MFVKEKASKLLQLRLWRAAIESRGLDIRSTMSCVSQLPQGSKKVKNKPPVLADKASFSLCVTLWCEEDFLEQNMRKRYMFFKQNGQEEDDEKARES